MPQHPRQRNGGRRHAVLVGDRLQRRLAQQRTLAERRIGHHHHVRLTALVEQLPFDAAAAEVIEHLVGRAVVAVRRTNDRCRASGVEVADTPLPDLAVLHQRLEGADGLLDRHRARPMQQIEIEAIGLEPFQAALAGRQHALARGVVRIDLADKENLVAPAGQRLRQHLLGTALAIHLGGVNEPDAEVQGELYGGHLARTLRLALAHPPRADAQHRHLVSALQRCLPHLPLHYRRSPTLAHFGMLARAWHA